MPLTLPPMSPIQSRLFFLDLHRNGIDMNVFLDCYAELAQTRPTQPNRFQRQEACTAWIPLHKFRCALYVPSSHQQQTTYAIRTEVHFTAAAYADSYRLESIPNTIRWLYTAGCASALISLGKLPSLASLTCLFELKLCSNLLAVLHGNGVLKAMLALFASPVRCHVGRSSLSSTLTHVCGHGECHCQYSSQP
jgi:hypothetical protein